MPFENFGIQVLGNVIGDQIGGVFQANGAAGAYQTPLHYQELFMPMALINDKFMIRKILVLVVALFGAFLVFVIIFQSTVLEPKLKEKHLITCGKINSVTPGKGGRGEIEYEFNYNNKIYTVKWVCTVNTRHRFEAGFDRILIVFYPEDPNLNRLLENSSDLVNWNVSLKDTLNLPCGSYL